MNWVQRYLIHILLTLLLALTALTWNNNATKVTETADEVAKTKERVSVVESEIGDLNRQLAVSGARELRMEEKLDALLQTVRERTR